MTLKLTGSAPVGTFKTQAIVLTDNEYQPEISINVLAYIRGLISLFPTQCYLGTLAPGQMVEKTFNLEKSGEVADLKAPVIKDAPEWLATAVETTQENRKYSIKVSIRIPEEMKGKLSGSFVIETGDPTIPQFEVPVFGYVLHPAIPTEGSTASKSSDSGSEAAEGSQATAEDETKKATESR